MSGDWNEQMERRTEGLVPGYVGNNDTAAPASAITGDLEQIVTGLAAGRPAANAYRGWYFSSDTGALEHSNGAAWAAPSGTSVPGTTLVRAFPFAFNSAGILTGHAVYAPTIGDILLDAWIEIDTAWDGTTPLADVGAFIGGDTAGWFGFWSGPVVMGIADISNGLEDPHGLLSQGTGGGAVTSSVFQGSMVGNVAAQTSLRAFPAKFVTADPIKVVVSQTGAVGGASPASTAGAAVLYLVTATPA